MTSCSDLESTIALMHNAQGYPMVCVRSLTETESISNRLAVFHHLFVFIGKGKCVEYVFKEDNMANDHLYSVGITTDLSMDEIMCRMAKEIIKDGFAYMQVYPQ